MQAIANSCYISSCLYVFAVFNVMHRSISISLVFKIKTFHKLLSTSPVFRAFFLFCSVVFNPYNGLLFNQMNCQHHKLKHFTLAALDKMYFMVTSSAVFVF